MLAAALACIAWDTSKVRSQSSLLRSLELLGVLDDIFDDIFKDDRAALVKVFGGDCHRVATMQALVEQLQVMIANSPHQHEHKADARLKRSINFCQSVESVLKDVNLGQTLAAAQQLVRPNIVMATVAEKETHAAPKDALQIGVDLFSDERQLQSMQAKRTTMFTDLDAADSCVEARASGEALFEEFDEDGNGILEDEEADMAISYAVTHVMREGAERSAKYRGRLSLPSEEIVREWVWKMVDEDGDGRITREEAIRGFKAVVDDIDAQEERRRSLLCCGPRQR